jgi:gamma-tubulin complex component 2
MRALGYTEPSFIAETSFVRAPLNSRVGSNGAVPKSKGKTKQQSLDHLLVEIQEALILEDLLYVLMVSSLLPEYSLFFAELYTQGN